MNNMFLLIVLVIGLTKSIEDGLTLTLKLCSRLMVTKSESGKLMPKDIVPTKTINNVDVTPLLQEVLEYSKSQATLGNVEELISKVPQKDSMDWKLISGVLCNAVIEWVAQDKDNRADLIHHLQSEVGYVLKRMGLTM